MQTLHFHIRTLSANVSLLPVEFKDSLQDWDSSHRLLYEVRVTPD